MWRTWCKYVDSRPFTVLTIMFIPIWIWEGVSKGWWLKIAILFLVSLVAAMLLSMLLKLVFKDDRGMEIKTIMDYRRPSAHTLIATTLSVVASLNDIYLSALLGFFVFLTAYSRIWIGVHTKRDVIEGLISGLILGILIYILEKYL